MKRIGVAGIIIGNNYDMLLGRRDKDPNRGLYVLPGGGVEDGETLEQAFAREVMEETGLEVVPTYNRWQDSYLIELEDRIILVARAAVKDPNANLKANGDLYDLKWFDFEQLPSDISPVVWSVLSSKGFKMLEKSNG